MAKKPKKSKAATTKAFRNLFFDLPLRGRLKKRPAAWRRRSTSRASTARTNAAT